MIDSFDTQVSRGGSRAGAAQSASSRTAGATQSRPDPAGRSFAEEVEAGRRDATRPEGRAEGAPTDRPGERDTPKSADTSPADAVPAETAEETRPRTRAGAAPGPGAVAPSEDAAVAEEAANTAAKPDARPAEGSSTAGEPAAEAVLAAASSGGGTRADGADAPARGGDSGVGSMAAGAAAPQARLLDARGAPLAQGGVPIAQGGAEGARHEAPSPAAEVTAARTAQGGAMELPPAARTQETPAVAAAESLRRGEGPRPGEARAGGEDQRTGVPASQVPPAAAGAAAAAAPFGAAALKAVAPAATGAGRGPAREILVEAVQGRSGEMAEAAAIDARAASDLSAARAAPSAAPTEGGRPLPGQLAEAARMLRDGPVELRLSPEELGRVRMTLTASDGQMTLSISAERAETLDLLRRNIDQLAQDFREMGYESLAFSFGREGAGDQGAPFGGEAETAADTLTDMTGAPGEAAAAPRRSVRIDGAGLDLRL